MAIGTNPIAKVTQAGGQRLEGGEAGSSVPAGCARRDGEKAVLRVGDMVQLVVEERVPASRAVRD